jgi:hypothetical protein
MSVNGMDFGHGTKSELYTPMTAANSGTMNSGLAVGSARESEQELRNQVTSGARLSIGASTQVLRDVWQFERTRRRKRFLSQSPNCPSDEDHVGDFGARSGESPPSY